MNFFKIILALLVLFLAVIGGLAVFGLLAAIVKYLFYFGVIALVGVIAYKALSKPARPQLEMSATDLELERAERVLAEIKSKQLTD